MTNDQLTQTLSQISINKQQLQREKIEVESAIEELSDSDTSYKIIGSIMVKKSAATLAKELADKRDKIDNQLQKLTTQEQDLRKQLIDQQNS